MSCDNFDTFLFATVSDRDPKELEKGFVQIIFSTESRRALAGVEAHQSFLMVETTAYFEAYRYVLEGLQDLEVEDLPFQRSVYCLSLFNSIISQPYVCTGYRTGDVDAMRESWQNIFFHHVFLILRIADCVHTVPYF